MPQRCPYEMQVDVQRYQKVGRQFRLLYFSLAFPSLLILFRFDASRSRVLKQLYSENSAYRDYDLIVVGHSLGGGCAQVLSLMLRPSFPSLRCYAYEPPVSRKNNCGFTPCFENTC